MATEVMTRWRISRKRPQPDVDGNREGEPARGGRYGDGYVLPLFAKKHNLVDEGSYFTFSMQPQATALQLGLSAAFSATAAAIVLYNGDTPGKNESLRVFPDYVRLNVMTAPTSGTALRLATVLDTASRVPTTVSNGTGGTGPGTPATATAYRSPVTNANPDDAANPVTQVYLPLSTSGGAPPTVPAASQNARVVVGNASLRAQIPVAGDEYVIDFGGDIPSGQLVTAAPAGASRVVLPHPPVALGPGHSLVIYLWAPSNATAGIAFDGIDGGLWER